MSHTSITQSTEASLTIFLPIKEQLEALQQEPKSESLEAVEKALAALAIQCRELPQDEQAFATHQLSNLSAELANVKQILAEGEDNSPFTEYNLLVDLSSMYRRGDLQQAKWSYDKLIAKTKEALCFHLWLLRGSPECLNFGAKGFEEPHTLPIDIRPSRYDLALAVETALTPTSVLVEIKKAVAVGEGIELHQYISLLPTPLKNQLFGETYKEKKEPKNVPFNFGELAFCNQNSFSTTQEEKAAIIDRVLERIGTSYEAKELITAVQETLKYLKGVDRTKKTSEEKKEAKQKAILDLIAKLLPLYCYQDLKELSVPKAATAIQILTEAFKVFPALMQCRALLSFASDINEPAPVVSSSGMLQSKENLLQVRAKAIRSIASKMLRPISESPSESRASPASLSGAPGYASQTRSTSSRYPESVASTEASSMASSPIPPGDSQSASSSMLAKISSSYKKNPSLSAPPRLTPAASLFGSASYLSCLKVAEERDVPTIAHALIQFSKIIQLLNLDVNSFRKHHTHTMGVFYKVLEKDLSDANELYQQLKQQGINEMASWLSLRILALQKKYEAAFGHWIDETIDNCQILALPSLSNQQILALQLETYQTTLSNITDNLALKDHEKATLFAGFVESIRLQTAALSIPNPMMASQVQKIMQRLAQAQQLNDPKLLSDLSKIHDSESYQREIVLDFWLSNDLCSQIQRERDQVLRLHLSFSKHPSYPYGDDLDKLIELLDMELAILKETQANALDLYIDTILTTERKVAKDMEHLVASGSMHPRIAACIKSIREPLVARIIETLPSLGPVFADIFAQYPR